MKIIYKKQITQILQIALTFAIFANAANLLQDQFSKIKSFSGIDEKNIFHITSVLYKNNQSISDRIVEDINIIRQFSEVINTTITNTVPLTSNGWSVPVYLKPSESDDPGGVDVATFMVNSDAINTFDLKLIAGSNFTKLDQVEFNPNTTNWASKVILTKIAAEGIFSNDANYGLGSLIYIDGKFPAHVIGIVQKLQGPWSEWEGVERSMLLPQTFMTKVSRYVVRVKKGTIKDVPKRVHEALEEISSNRYLLKPVTFLETKNKSYHSNIITSKILIVITLIFIIVSMFGIAGLTSVKLELRKKEIIINRAFGASRNTILKQILLDNLKIIIIASFIGILFAYLLNEYLIVKFSLSTLNYTHIFSALVIVIASGQIATLLASFNLIKQNPFS